MRHSRQRLAAFEVRLAQFEGLGGSDPDAELDEVEPVVVEAEVRRERMCDVLREICPGPALGLLDEAE